jgi:CheY-like chemotaxis protein
MDIMMPVMDGYETMRAIRGLEQFKTLPMIAVTGKVMAGERQRCIDAGANDYAAKPIDTSELLTAVKQWVPGLARRTPDVVPAVPVVCEPVAADADSPVAFVPGVEADDQQPVESSSSGKAPGGGVRSKILVVDDDFRNTFALSALLERGHIVLVADSGAEALAELEGSPDIDVVLMDIVMPIMDGYETMRAIRAVDRFNAIPIIAVTGKVMPGERERCIDSGANDYVPKPVDSAELFAALRPWLSTAAQPTAA